MRLNDISQMNLAELLKYASYVFWSVVVYIDICVVKIEGFMRIVKTTGEGVNKEMRS